MVNLLGFLFGSCILASALILVLIVFYTVEPAIDVAGDYEDSLDPDVDIEFTRIRTNGIELHTALAGPLDGKPLILLHGFPDNWTGWESQVRYFAARGFRVAAPDINSNISPGTRFLFLVYNPRIFSDYPHIRLLSVAAVPGSL